MRALYTSYVAGADSALARHRGKPPRQLAFLLRSARLRNEAAVLGGMLKIFSVLAPNGAIDSLRPSLAMGLRLCEAYETYTELVATPELSLEQARDLL